MFERKAGRILLGTLFSRALGASYELGLAARPRLKTHLNRESLAVLRATLLHQIIRRLGAGGRLQSLLQSGLVVGDCQSAIAGDAVNFRIDDMIDNDPSYRVQSAIEVNGRQDCLQSIYQQGWLIPASTLFFAAAQVKVGA